MKQIPTRDIKHTRWSQSAIKDNLKVQSITQLKIYNRQKRHEVEQKRPIPPTMKMARLHEIIQLRI